MYSHGIEYIYMPKTAQSIVKDNNVEYTRDQIKEIYDQINIQKSKNFFITLKKIIFMLNPELDFDTNSRGIVLTFDNLVPNTYYQIEKLLKKYNKKQKNIYLDKN